MSNFRPVSSFTTFTFFFSIFIVASLESLFTSFDIFSSSDFNLSSSQFMTRFTFVLIPAKFCNDLNMFCIILPFLFTSYALFIVLSRS